MRLVERQHDGFAVGFSLGFGNIRVQLLQHRAHIQVGFAIKRDDEVITAGFGGE